MLSNQTSLARLHVAVEEATQLLAQRPTCHGCQNDLGAIDLIVRLYMEDPSTDLTPIMDCLERMRIACAAGTYPAHMLTRP